MLHKIGLVVCVGEPTICCYCRAPALPSANTAKDQHSLRPTPLGIQARLGSVHRHCMVAAHSPSHHTTVLSHWMVTTITIPRTAEARILRSHCTGHRTVSATVGNLISSCFFSLMLLCCRGELDCLRHHRPLCVRACVHMSLHACADGVTDMGQTLPPSEGSVCLRQHVRMIQQR